MSFRKFISLTLAMPICVVLLISQRIYEMFEWVVSDIADCVVNAYEDMDEFWHDLFHRGDPT